MPLPFIHISPNGSAAEARRAGKTTGRSTTPAKADGSNSPKGATAMLPLKQIVKLTNVSFQNLNVMRKRLLRKLYGKDGNGRDFDARIRQEG